VYYVAIAFIVIPAGPHVVVVVDHVCFFDVLIYITAVGWQREA
jgi:hypothetical protein